MILKAASALLAALVLQGGAMAQQSVPWGDSAKTTARQNVPGMRTYYEPEKVQVNGSVRAFTLYRSANPGAADEAGRYMINCETREIVQVTNGQAGAPYRLIAGEEHYLIGRKLCDWDPPGIFKKLFD